MNGAEISLCRSLENSATPSSPITVHICLFRKQMRLRNVSATNFLKSSSSSSFDVSRADITNPTSIADNAQSSLSEIYRMNILAEVPAMASPFVTMPAPYNDRSLNYLSSQYFYLSRNTCSSLTRGQESYTFSILRCVCLFKFQSLLTSITLQKRSVTLQFNISSNVISPLRL